MPLIAALFLLGMAVETASQETCDAFGDQQSGATQRQKLGVSPFGSSADFSLRAVLKRLCIEPAKDVSILQIGDEVVRNY